MTNGIMQQAECTQSKFSTSSWLMGTFLALGLMTAPACDTEGNSAPESVHPEPADAAADASTPAAAADEAQAPMAEAAAAPIAPAAGSACPDGVGVDESFKIDCNTCKCTATGVTGCTYINCEAQRASKKTVQCAGGRKVGETWKDACNTCSCSSEGKAQCTLMGCGDDVERTCDGARKVGESWKQDCNTCKCNADFKIACTEMACG